MDKEKRWTDSFGFIVGNPLALHNPRLDLRETDALMSAWESQNKRWTKSASDFGCSPLPMKAVRGVHYHRSLHRVLMHQHTPKKRALASLHKQAGSNVPWRHEPECCVRTKHSSAGCWRKATYAFVPRGASVLFLSPVGVATLAPIPSTTLHKNAEKKFHNVEGICSVAVLIRRKRDKTSVCLVCVPLGVPYSHLTSGGKSCKCVCRLGPGRLGRPGVFEDVFRCSLAESQL